MARILMVARFHFKKLFCIVLVAYSTLHFVSSSGIKPGSAIGGDFISGFPSFWSWSINPKLILENKSVQGWMGGETIELNEKFCQEKIFDFQGKELMDSTVQPPSVCKKYLKKKELLGLTELKPETVKNRTWQYGPMMHFATFPLLYLDSFRSALRTWHTVSILLYFCLIFIWYEILFIERGLASFFTGAIFIAIWFNFSPAYDTLKGAEIETLEFFLLSLFIRYLFKGAEVKAGVALALSVFVKYVPAIFLPYLIWRRKFKTLGAALFSMSLLWVLTEYTLGWDWSYTGRLIQKIGNSTTATGSQSFSSLIYRLFTRFDLFHDSTDTLARLPVTQPELAFLITKIFTFSILAFYGILFLLKPGKKINLYEISLLSLLMVTITYWNHLYYLIFLLMGYSVAFSYLCLMRKETGHFPKGETSVLFFSFVVLGYFFPGTVYHHIFKVFGLDFWSTYTVLSIPVYGYTILLVWLTIKMVKQKNASYLDIDPYTQPQK